MKSCSLTPLRRSAVHSGALALLLAAVLAPPPANAEDPGQDQGRCVDAKVGSAESYGCLTQSLQNLAAQRHPDMLDTTVTATSPSNQVGTFNQAGVKEHLGPNFGKSSVPYRPANDVFHSPLIHTR